MPTISHEGLLRGQCISRPSLEGFPADLLKRLYRGMLRLRRCEEALLREYHPADEIRCPVHFCIGQEAVSASLSVLLRPQDHLFSHHRSHGYYLGKGAPMRELFAELYGRATGASGGKAGSQDISHPESHFYSGAILCGAVAIGVGAAFAEQVRGGDSVVVTGFGEAATDEGVFWEAVNYAALKRLPIVFVCENNRYSTYSPQVNRHAADNIHDRVEAFGVRSHALFGNDVLQVYRALESAVTAARSRQGPTFVEAYTYRWNGHVGPESDDHVGYRPAAEVQFWKDHCPIRLLEEAMAAAGTLAAGDQAALVREVDEEIADAFAFAKGSAFPAGADWRECNHSPHTPLADRLLHDVEAGAFDQYQAELVPGPY
jgi:TPP-dependent pyruvate/acetoin dehydrogenase alpha subunit